MSKYVKDLVTRDIQRRLEGVQDAVVVSTSVWMPTRPTNCVANWKSKNIHMMVVKNSLARRATEGTNWHRPSRDQRPSRRLLGIDGLCFARQEIVAFDKNTTSTKSSRPSGGAMDGEARCRRIKAVSKWPSREEQISMLVGQILAPGANLSAALLGPGKQLASQIKKIGEKARQEAR